jgi:hypothetical protein
MLNTIYKNHALAGQNSIQALFTQLTTEDFTWEYQASKAGNYTHLFFATLSLLDLITMYPVVLILDCTYRTNHFGLPLLNNVTIAGLGTSFYLAVAFIKAEAEKDFTQALKQLAKIWPRSPHEFVTDCDLALIKALFGVFPESAPFLCLWHIHKNVVARSKLYFCNWASKNKMGEVAANLVAASDPVSDFMKAWNSVIFAVSE